jgi:hypothetical protein
MWVLVVGTRGSKYNRHASLWHGYGHEHECCHGYEYGFTSASSPTWASPCIEEQFSSLQLSSIVIPVKSSFWSIWSIGYENWRGSQHIEWPFSRSQWLGLPSPSLSIAFRFHLASDDTCINISISKLVNLHSLIWASSLGCKENGCNKTWNNTLALEQLCGPGISHMWTLEGFVTLHASFTVSLIFMIVDLKSYSMKRILTLRTNNWCMACLTGSQQFHLLLIDSLLHSLISSLHGPITVMALLLMIRPCN